MRTHLSEKPYTSVTGTAGKYSIGTCPIEAAWEQGRYDTQEVPFGTVYRWCPGCIVVECDCGEELTLNGSMSTCSECGADHTSVVREELSPRQLGKKTFTPDATTSQVVAATGSSQWYWSGVRKPPVYWRGFSCSEHPAYL